MADKELWITEMRGGKGPKKGRFTAWCQAHGFSGPTRACIEVASKSKDASVRGMAIFAERSKEGF